MKTQPTKSDIQNRIYDNISGAIIKMLEGLKNDPMKWERPWIVSENGLGAHNAQSKHRYSGINQLVLSFICLDNGYSFNRWLTYKQVTELGGNVKKGEHATMVIFSKTTQILTTKDIPLDQRQENDITEGSICLKSRFYMTYYNVFNVCQCEGLNEEFYTPYIKGEAFNAPVLAEMILNNCGAKIQYCEQKRAFYTLHLDLISLPHRTQFPTMEGFFETVFHELGHWTGHPDRLNRKLFNMFGSNDYAREELTAEMTSVFLNSLLGIDVKLKNCALYLDSWLQALKDDNKAMINAIMQAQTACNFILDASGMGYLRDSACEEAKEEKKQTSETELVF